ncbi:MAG: serine hydrolase [Candidatus Nealsonbacteria bacterium]
MDNKYKTLKNEENSRLKFFFISFFIAFVFGLGINIILNNSEKAEISEGSELLTAQMNIVKSEKESKLNFDEDISEDEDFVNNEIPEIEDLEIRAKSAISVEINQDGTETILFEKNSKSPLPIASLSKLMTALVIFDLKESYNFSQVIRISKTAIDQEGVSGKLKEGEYLSVENLLKIMLIQSSNDAAYALTEPISQSAFVDLMNIYAQDIGLKNTKFFNSTGLEPIITGAPRNYSSTEDLVKLSIYILKNYPRIFEITAKTSAEILNVDGSLHHFITKNTNNLLKEIPEIIGGKTGWNPVSQGCLLIVLDNGDGSRIINVILGAYDRFSEMKKLIKITE